MPLGVAVLDADSQLRYWNPHAAALFGVPPMLAEEAPRLADLLAAGGRLTSRQAERLGAFCDERIAAGEGAEAESWLRLASDRGRRLVVQLLCMGAASWLMLIDDRTPVLAGQGASDAALDALTGLGNRRQFMTALDSTLGAAGPDDRFALLAAGLDRFKTVNQALGHHAGDALLALAAQRLRREVREDDLLARLGGDEFVILAHGAASAGALAARVVDVLSRPFLVEGNVVTVSASVGVALFPQHGPSAADLMRHADLALCDAKSGGGRNWRIFLPGMAIEAKAGRDPETGPPLEVQASRP
jgi:diguanylate cyclase (GGDEF)-like protein